MKILYEKFKNFVVVSAKPKSLLDGYPKIPKYQTENSNKISLLSLEQLKDLEVMAKLSDWEVVSHDFVMEFLSVAVDSLKKQKIKNHRELFFQHHQITEKEYVIFRQQLETIINPELFELIKKELKTKLSQNLYLRNVDISHGFC